MLEDWRFEKSPYVEFGGLCAYAGAPLRLQNETGDTVCLGSICVASSTRREPLTRAQQTTLARLADWIVADIVQLARARRQRERRRMVEMLAAMQEEIDGTVSEKPVMRMLQTAYPGAAISLQRSSAGHIELEGQNPISLSDFSGHLWEDIDHIDEFITKSNHLEPPIGRIVRAIAVPCEIVSGHAFLIVGSKDFRQIFDDVDDWFVKACADMLSQMWHKRLLTEVMVTKEKFLRGFSHQLRTPVHGILGSVELLAEELKLRSWNDTTPNTSALLKTTSVAHAHKSHEVYLDTIKRAGCDLISIINSMITLNRWADVAITDRQYAIYTTYELETEIVNEVQKVISGDTRYNASIFFNHSSPPDNYSLRTDLGLLRDSLLPIIINAIQSTTEGLVVITLSIRPDSKQLVFDIKDTGRGIPSDDHQRIFELYEQVDVYSTGAGLGLTLASRFAALLKGSIDLVSSEINRGSHFRVTFQDIELICSESSQPIEPIIPQLANIPQRFHVVQSKPMALSLSDHFAMSLTYHGFTASDDIDDILIILDFVADPEQHRAALARIPSNLVVICIVPFLEGEEYFNSTAMNVVYIHGPFGTQAMISALKHADRIISLFKVNQMDTFENMGNLAGFLSLNESASNDWIGCEGGQDSITQAADEVAKDPILDQNSLIYETAYDVRSYAASESPNPFQPHRIENKLPVDTSWFRRGQPPTPPPEDGFADLSFNSSAITIVKDSRITSGIRQNPKSIPILLDPAITSHPTALLVDDNIINLRVMQMYCDKRNLRYVCAKDGLEAVSIYHDHQESAMVKKREPPIRLILMDLQMPFCGGIEATRRIRELEVERHWDKSVVLIVTGQDSSADREAANGAGSQEYHVKPVSMKTLDMSLKRYFPFFRENNRL